MLNKIIYTVLGISLAVIFLPHAAFDSVRKSVVSGVSIQKSQSSQTKSAPEMAILTPPPILTSKAALAYDLDTGTILYSNNLDQRLPIASLTKLVTALTVVQTANLGSVVTIGKKEQGLVGSTIGLLPGEQITVDGLLRAMLIPSSNDAAIALADFIAGSDDEFAALMNQKAASLNLSSTHFSNAVGWDIGDNYSSTLDLIKIAKEFLKNDNLREIVKTQTATISSVDGKYSHVLQTTNKLLLTNPEVEGIKTGFTSEAKGNLIILANHLGHQVLTIVLGSDSREADTERLLNWLFQVYRW